MLNQEVFDPGRQIRQTSWKQVGVHVEAGGSGMGIGQGTKWMKGTACALMC